jgi:hypothetical protein
MSTPAGQGRAGQSPSDDLSQVTMSGDAIATPAYTEYLRSLDAWEFQITTIIPP